MSEVSANPQLLSISRAAELGYGSESTLRNRIKDGTLRAQKVSGKLRVTVEDLDAMAAPVTYSSRSSMFVDAVRRVDELMNEVGGRLTLGQRRELAALIYSEEMD